MCEEHVFCSYIYIYVVDWSIAILISLWYALHMPSRWTLEEERKYRRELERLYVCDNKTIAEVGRTLGIAPQTVFQRLQRIDVTINPSRKKSYLNRRQDIRLPTYTATLAEFLGIMLGDGHLSHFQFIVSLGTKEEQYAVWVAKLCKQLFGVTPKIAVRTSGYRDVYFGSVHITKWLRAMGLVGNKVKSQIDIPRWIFENHEFMKRFVRGFFDTDGSVYQIRYGIQISFTNHSLPLLASLRKMLIVLGYKPSRLSSWKVYITHQEEVRRFFGEISPKNFKHIRRFKAILEMRR